MIVNGLGISEPADLTEMMWISSEGENVCYEKNG